MADLDVGDVMSLARLARLELEPDEAARLAGELGQILGAMAALAAVDTDGIEPMTHAVPRAVSLRPDVVAPSLEVDDALAAAPDRDGDSFRVPAAIAAKRGDG